MDSIFRVLMLGDVVGGAGLTVLQNGLPDLVNRFEPNFILANAENATDGFGITSTDVDRVFAAGVNVITTGNHVWQKRDVFQQAFDNKVLRPANYPDGAPGIGWTNLRVDGTDIGVVNVQGRTRLSNIDCPFRTMDAILDQFADEIRIVLVDFHAEDTEEKESMGHYLAGRVSALAGTHTHVQTADERIIDGATAYISDIGMTGPKDSVIGFEPTIAVERMVTQMPLKMQVSQTQAVIRGVFVQIDATNGNALSIERIEYIPDV